MSASERYQSAGAFRAALQDRLRQSAVGKSSNWLVRRRKFMALDRFLARLMVVALDRWLLKGDDWAAPYRVLATDTGLDPDIAAGHALVARFLNPIPSEAIPASTTCDAALGAWQQPLGGN